jgi:hypothetical protein
MDNHKDSFRQIIDILMAIVLVSSFIFFLWLGYKQYYP